MPEGKQLLDESYLQMLDEVKALAATGVDGGIASRLVLARRVEQLTDLLDVIHQIGMLVVQSETPGTYNWRPRQPIVPSSRDAEGA